MKGDQQLMQYLVILMYTTEPGTYDASPYEKHYTLKASSPIDAAQKAWNIVAGEYANRAIELDSVFATAHSGMDN